MASFSQFYPYITPWLKGITEPMMDQAIRQTARDIATRTSCETVTQRFSSVVGEKNYVLTPGSEREPVRVLDAYFRTEKLALTAELDVTNPLALVGDIDDAPAIENTPTCAYTDNPLTTLIVYPLPSQAIANVITARFSIRPTITSLTVPDILLQYERVLADGVVARCQAMPAQPFSDVAASREANMRYEIGLATMRAEILRGNARTLRRVKPMKFM